MSGLGDHWYVCVAELTAGQARWDVARDRCRERHRMYEAMGLITKGIQMSDVNTKSVAEPGVGSTIVTGEGVKEAGPDIPALAAATQREENARAAAMDASAIPRDQVRAEKLGDLRSPEDRDRDREWADYLTRCGELGERPIERSVWQQRTRAAGFAPAHVGGPVGRVSPEQAGILPSGPMRVTDAMVYRAQQVLMGAVEPTGASAVRAALKAALTG